MKNVLANPVVVAINNIWTFVLTGWFIKMMVIYIVIAGFMVNSGYNTLTSLDREYGFSQSAEYITVATNTCSALFDRASLTLVKDFTDSYDGKSSSCSELAANKDYLNNIVARHDSHVRGISDPTNFWIYPVVFIIFIGVMYANLSTDKMLFHPTSSFIGIVIGWLIFAIALAPFTFAAYRSTSIYRDGDTNISIQDVRLTTDGGYFNMPRTYMGKIIHVKDTYPQKF